MAESNGTMKFHWLYVMLAILAGVFGGYVASGFDNMSIRLVQLTHEKRIAEVEAYVGLHATLSSLENRIDVLESTE